MDGFSILKISPCKVYRSPYPPARIKSMDTSKTKALSGVRCVLRVDPEVRALKPASHAWIGIAITPYDCMTLCLDSSIEGYWMTQHAAWEMK